MFFLEIVPFSLQLQYGLWKTSQQSSYFISIWEPYAVLNCFLRRFLRFRMKTNVKTMPRMKRAPRATTRIMTHKGIPPTSPPGVIEAPQESFKSMMTVRRVCEYTGVAAGLQPESRRETEIFVKFPTW